MYQKKVYYFTQRVFKTCGWSGYYELVCERLLEGDPKINEYYKKYHNIGHIYQIDYGLNKFTTYNLDFEKSELLRLSKYDCATKYQYISEITIINKPEELK